MGFARSEYRFHKHFLGETESPKITAGYGEPSPELLASKAERLANWRLLQELAGIKSGETAKVAPVKQSAASSDAAAKQKANERKKKEKKIRMKNKKRKIDKKKKRERK